MQASASTPRLIILVLCAAVLIGCRTLDKEISVSSVVTRARGAAYYSTDDGQTWRPARPTRTVPSSCIVRTGSDAVVEINLSGYEPVEVDLSSRANVIRIESSSLLKIDAVKVNLLAPQKHLTSEIRLTLLKGWMTGDLSNTEGSPSYLVKFNGGSMSVGNALFMLGSEGLATVFKGSINMKPEGEDPIAVDEGFSYDAKTKMIPIVDSPVPKLSSRPPRISDSPKVPT